MKNLTDPHDKLAWPIQPNGELSTAYEYRMIITRRITWKYEYLQKLIAEWNTFKADDKGGSYRAIAPHY